MVTALPKVESRPLRIDSTIGGSRSTLNSVATQNYVLSLNSQEMIYSQAGFEDARFCSRAPGSPFVVRFIVVIDVVLLVEDVDEDATRSH